MEDPSNYHRQKRLWEMYGRALVTISILGLITVALYVAAHRAHVLSDFIAGEHDSGTRSGVSNDPSPPLDYAVKSVPIDGTRSRRSASFLTEAAAVPKDDTPRITALPKLFPLNHNVANMQKSRENAMKSHDSKITEDRRKDSNQWISQISSSNIKSSQIPKITESTSTNKSLLSDGIETSDPFEATERRKRDQIIIREDEGIAIVGRLRHSHKNCLACVITPHHYQWPLRPGQRPHKACGM